MFVKNLVSVNHWSDLFFRVVSRDNSTNSKISSASVYNKLLGKIWIDQYERVCESVLKGLKILLLCRTPFKWMIQSREKRGLLSLKKLAFKWQYYPTMPRNTWTSLRLAGTVMFCTASIFLSMCLIPLTFTFCAKSSRHSLKKEHLQRLSLRSAAYIHRD